MPIVFSQGFRAETVINSSPPKRKTYLEMYLLLTAEYFGLEMTEK